MTIEDIYESLCAYDPRNPDYDKDCEREPRTNCSCDNCFYGRDELALEILKLRKELEDSKSCKADLLGTKEPNRYNIEVIREAPRHTTTTPSPIADVYISKHLKGKYVNYSTYAKEVKRLKKIIKELIDA
jgi:hypothetical protein